MTKKRFLKLCEDCFVTKEEYMQEVTKLLKSGVIDIENFEDNYRPIFPIALAIYERLTQWYIAGSIDHKWRRKARRAANIYKSTLTSR